jgi:hypothetical protein
MARAVTVAAVASLISDAGLKLLTTAAHDPSLVLAVSYSSLKGEIC